MGLTVFAGDVVRRGVCKQYDDTFSLYDTKKAPLVPWATVPWNVLHIGGTGPPTFDFQSRPDVDRLQRRGAPCFLLRFKDSISTRV